MEPRRSRFSLQTVLHATDILKALTHKGFEQFVIKLNLRDREVGYGTSLQARANSIARFARDNPNAQTGFGELLDDHIVEKAASLITGYGLPSVSEDEQQAFLRSLERDGFSVTDKKLTALMPEVADLPAADDEVHALLASLEFATATGHLDQAIDAHARGNWAAANSQLRTFLEALFDEIALRLEPEKAAATAGGHHRRSLLANTSPPFLSRDLKEWDDGGKGYINGLIARLNPQGSHPGLSDQEDCTFRLHIVIITARLLLRRLAAPQS